MRGNYRGDQASVMIETGVASVDFQDAFNVVFAIAIAMGGWIAGRISKTLDRLDEDVRKMPENYVSKKDYRDDMHDIKQALLRIESKLDGKADK